MENYTVDDYALCTRFKSKRRKKRLVKKDFDKQLIQLIKLENSLYDKRRNLPFVPLETPYQRGWQRNFVLREDVSRSSEASFYNELLEKINTWQFSPEKSFKRKKKRKTRYMYVEKIQTVKEFSEWEWKSSKLELTEKEKAHFYKREQWCSNWKRYKIHYVFSEPWRYVLRVSPYMITHTKMVDSDLEAQIQQIDNYIVNRNLRKRICKLMCGYARARNYYKSESRNNINSLKNKSLHTLYQQYADEMIENHGK